MSTTLGRSVRRGLLMAIAFSLACPTLLGAQDKRYWESCLQVSGITQFVEGQDGSLWVVEYKPVFDNDPTLKGAKPRLIREGREYQLQVTPSDWSSSRGPGDAKAPQNISGQMTLNAFRFKGEKWVRYPGERLNIIGHRIPLEFVNFAGARVAGQVLNFPLSLDAKADQDSLWLLTQGQTRRLAEGKWTLYREPLDSAQGEAATQVAITDDGAAWVATNKGRLYRLKNDTWDNLSKGLNLAEGDSIHVVKVLRDSSLWISTTNGHLWQHLENRWTYYAPPRLQRGDEIDDFLVDQKDAIWVISDSGKLYRLTGKEWTLLNGKSQIAEEDQVNIIEEAPSGSMLVGTSDGKLLQIIQTQPDKWASFNLDSEIVNIFPEGDDSAWLQTEYHTLFRLKSGKLAANTSFGFNITDVVLAKDGSLWVAANTGLFRFTLDQKFDLTSTVASADPDIQDLTMINGTEMWAQLDNQICRFHQPRGSLKINTTNPSGRLIDLTLKLSEGANHSEWDLFFKFSHQKPASWSEKYSTTSFDSEGRVRIIAPEKLGSKFLLSATAVDRPARKFYKSSRRQQDCDDRDP